MSLNYLRIPLGLRVFVALYLLFFTLILDTLTALVAQGVLFVSILYWQERRWYSLLQALRWLRWLVVPTLVLHAYMTPGHVIAYLNCTVEGCYQGSFLALRLVALFLGAMVLIRIISLNEWYQCLRYTPSLQQWMTPYVLMFVPLHGAVKEALHQQVAQWRRESKRWRKVLPFLLSWMLEMLQVANQVADDLYSHWDARVTALMQGEDRAASHVLSMLMIVFLCLWSLLCVQIDHLL
ncbi:MAG: hypothetical protein HQM07_06965 [Zetaproteobacteria bacterium]|nr:hypothetical protein [Zetaproteobacteria bacterium]